MENLLLVIIFLPLLTAIGIKIISNLVNEVLLNFLTIKIRMEFYFYEKHLNQMAYSSCNVSRF